MRIEEASAGVEQVLYLEYEEAGAGAEQVLYLEYEEWSKCCTWSMRNGAGAVPGV
jgi:hypothetical protein